MREIYSSSFFEKMSAKYKGRDVTLNKPIRTPGESKAKKVYVKDPDTGNVKVVRFGDPDMKNKPNDKDARKSFRARHKCDEIEGSDSKKKKLKPRYWSCRDW